MFGAAGCRKSAPPAPPPPDVEVAPVVQKDVPVTQEWIGTLDGSVNAQIRAQVSGYLVKQLYTEGAAVHKGDPLFKIDPRPFEAALAQAKAGLAEAQAQQGKADLDVKRFTPLVRDKAISQQELDDALQASLAANAQVQAAQAAVDTAELNVGFTDILSPIDGVAGIALGQIGDLVGPATGSLTTVSTVDPIKAYFPISEQAYLDFRKADPAAGGLPAAIEFHLILADGTAYAHPGTLFALDRQIDVGTGTIRVAAAFPNPDNLLRPGQYARVRAVVSVRKGALLVPARAVSELQGAYQLATVDASNVAHIAAVTLGEQLGSQVVVLTGIAPGGRVVAEGIQKIQDGHAVNPLPYTPVASK